MLFLNWLALTCSNELRMNTHMVSTRSQSKIENGDETSFVKAKPSYWNKIK